MNKVSIVVPNWNGAKDLPKCLDSLLNQSVPTDVILVDNGSTDDSVELVESKYPKVSVIELDKNYGFTGAVNAGIEKAIENGSKYIALFNNDATADKNWLEYLVKFLDGEPRAGIATSKILSADGKLFDSTGDTYTTWGLPYPRGRGEQAGDKYDKQVWVFAASGGASLYRTKALEGIGLFDADFFAYYEDVDISFRAQLAGWKVGFEPKSIAYHQISATGGRIHGFSTYQTMKNLPWLFWKNVPGRLILKILPRFSLAYLAFLFSAVGRGQTGPAAKGLLVSLIFMPKKIFQRISIQRRRKVSPAYIASLLIYDLPPNAQRLRRLRAKYWHLIGRTPR